MKSDFRLAAVRKQRRRVVEILSRELAEARRRTARIQVRLEELDRELAEVMEASDPRRRGEVLVADMIAKTAWLDHLQIRRRSVLLELEDARGEVASRQKHLDDAWKDLEIVDGLHDRHEAEQRARTVRREIKEMDEIAGLANHRERESTVAGSDDRSRSATASSIPGKGMST